MIVPGDVSADEIRHFLVYALQLNSHLGISPNGLLGENYGARVTGVTLSREQMAWAVEHNAHPNIEYRFQDYREVTGKFDRIYSVGMFEHVGRNSYETFFDKCYELLKDDGIMLIHTMGWARRGPWNHNAFVNKYIFPGGEMPTMSHMTMEYSDSSLPAPHGYLVIKESVLLEISSRPVDRVARVQKSAEELCDDFEVLVGKNQRLELVISVAYPGRKT
ncbi:cfa [Symbiodinium sp. CCMP2592]|nr:cfa [Symbiodinium sp. CCMP2592]